MVTHTHSHRPVIKLHRHCKGILSTVAMVAMLGAYSLGSPQAMAATVTVPDGANLYDIIPAEGDIWNLQGNAFVSDGASPLILKAIPAELTINGNSSGSTITMSDGAGHYAFFSIGVTTISLANVTFTGSLHSGDGGVFSLGNVLNIASPGSTGGSVSFQSNTVGGSAAALFSGGTVSINGTFDNFTFATNTAGGNGGAISAATGITISGNYDTFAIKGNTSGGGGGGLYTNGSVTISGNYGLISLTDNAAGTDGGAIHAGGDVTVSATTSQAMVLSNNSDTAGSGGAIHAEGNVDINPDVVMNDNSAGGASVRGGAIYAAGTSILFRSNVNAEGNSSSDAGGVIALFTSGTAPGTILFNNPNATLNFSDNTTGVRGGAIASVSPEDNGRVLINGANITFSGNSAQSGAGGAIWTGYMQIDANGPTTFANNTAGTNGGAIFAIGTVSITESAGVMSFTANSAGSGNGGAIWLGGNLVISANGGDVIFSGNNQSGSANAIWLDNTAGNSIVSFRANTGNTIRFSDPIQNNSANGQISIIKSGPGLLSFDGSQHGASADRWSQIYGNTTVQAGTFEVANNAVYGVFAADVAGAEPTGFTTAQGSTLQGGGVGSIRADNVTLNGDLNIAGSQVNTRSTFNIDTHSLTLGGGAIHFNTFLNDGIQQNTDVLNLNLHGSAVSGQGIITVTNVGGTGDVTVGDGIKLIETNGTGTTAGAFALGSRVAEGAYEYTLYYGGDPMNGGNPNDQNWYLRNTLTITEPPPEGSAPGTPPTVVQIPNVRPEVALAQSMQPLALEYGIAMLGPVHERIGEYHPLTLPSATEERVVWCKDAARHHRCVVRVPTPSGFQNQTRWATSGWARVIGERGFHEPGNFRRRGPDYDYTFGGIQAGLDIFAREQSDGTLDKLGMYMGYGQVRSNVKGLLGLRAGSVDMDAFTLAGYWTHFSPAGWYTDAVVQGTWYSTDARSRLGQTLKPDGFGILGSFEGGYIYRFGTNWTLEPQAQIIFQHVSFDNVRDAFGFGRFDDTDSLRGRLGLRLSKSWNMAETGAPQRFLTAWLQTNVWHEFLGKAKTSFGRFDGNNLVPFNSYLGGTWGEIRAGATAQVSERVSAFASAGYHHSFDNRGREGWDGRLGVTVKW